MTAYGVLPIDQVPDAQQTWQRLAEQCPDAWFWHTWANLQFNLVAGQKSEARNLSFFVTHHGQPVGLVPLLVNRTALGGIEMGEASYYGGPLPWPAFLPEVADRETAEQFAFAELEARARQGGAERMRLRLEPATPVPEERARLERAVSAGYLDSSYVSYYLAVNECTLGNVRERYRRYVKKFSPLYELLFADGDAVTPDLEETYFHLHVKDAGGQFRSRESYRSQADLARAGEAFFVIAKRLANGVIGGMLLVSAYKKAAYDNSVGVDPDYQGEYVSHLLKWAAIEELLRRGVVSYELGMKSDLPGFMSLPSDKNRGISHFKEGWAREWVRRVAVAEKFFTARSLQAFMKAQADSLEQYFGLR